MKKTNYDNALTELNESINFKKSLYEQNEKLMKMVASSMVQLNLIDSKGNNMLSENDIMLLEASFLEKIKEKWGNLWSRGASSSVESAISKLPEEDQKLLKNTSKKLAEKYGKECIEYAKSQGLDGEELKLGVQNCISSKIESGPLKKMLTFFRKPLTKSIVSSVLLILVTSSIFGLPGKFDSQTTTDIKGGDQKMEIKFDGDLNNKFTDPNDSSTFDLATQQGVSVKGDLGSKISVDYDTGSAKLKADQQSKIKDKSLEIIDNIKQRVAAGETDIVVKITTQGNASNDGANWNHNNDTGGDTLNQDRADTTTQSIQPLVKSLEKAGIKVQVNKTVGEKGSSVEAGTKYSDATETGSISVDVDSKTPVKTTTTTDTEWTQGDIAQPVRYFGSPVPKACHLVLNGKKVVLGNDDDIFFYGKLDKKSIQTQEKGVKFSGIITKGSKANGDVKFELKVLGGFTADENNQGGLQSGNYLAVQITKLNDQDSKDTNTYLVPCGMESEGGKRGEDKGSEGEVVDGVPGEGGEKSTDKPIPQKEFLKGNRNMQLAYLAKYFLPNGESLWTRLNLKEGSNLPSGFFDAALGQGQYDTEKYLNKYYDYLVKENAFSSKISKEDWLSKVRDNKNLALIAWIRNTRKGIGTFFKNLKLKYEDLGIGDRSKAFVSKPGELGKAMGTVGDSVEGRHDLINEEVSAFNDYAKKAGFSEDILMKNLPQFMDMLNSMYFGLSGKNLGYDKQAVMNRCKKYGCKDTKSNTFKKQVSKDYAIMDENYRKQIREELQRIKQLMK